MIIDKSVKSIYAAGSKIVAVLHQNKTLWGHIDVKLSISVRIGVFNASGTFVIEGKEYALRNRRKQTLTVSNTEFTFIVKANAGEKYGVRFNGEFIYKDEEASPEGKKYTVTLDETNTNTIYIVFKE